MGKIMSMTEDPKPDEIKKKRSLTRRRKKNKVARKSRKKNRGK